MTVYDMAKVDPNFSTQIAYIDSVFLDGDMKRLLPLTALYAPNPEWEGKQVEMNNIAKGVLENMMFGTLLWCDKLRNMTGTSVTSVNEKNWTITINDKKFPCFETLGQSTGTPPMKACITKCDILALNGIVHELDTLLLSETATTGPPSAFSATNSGSSGSNTSTSGGQQPQSSPTVFYRQSAPGVNAPGAAPSVKAGSKSGAISQSLVVATAAVLLLTSLI